MDKFQIRAQMADKFFAKAQPKDSPPTGLVTGGGSTKDYFKNVARDEGTLKKYRTIYEQGGIVSQAIDCYAGYMLMNGYHLDGDDAAKKKVQDFLDKINFEETARLAIIDALLMGDCFQEIIGTVGGYPDNMFSLDASTMKIDYDTHGVINGYKQTQMIQGQKVDVPMKPEQVFHCSLLRAPGTVYGLSLIKRAYDDIYRDVQTMEGATVAIRRVGYPLIDVTVGTETDHCSGRAELEDTGKAFNDVKSDNTFVHDQKTKIENINAGGITGLESYVKVSTTRMLSALGVPGELLGYREGTTDNTAVSRIGSFYKRITSFQKLLAREYNTQLLDRLTNTPGAVKLVFNDAAQEDFAGKIANVKNLTSVDSLDPYGLVGKDWIYEYLDIDDPMVEPDTVDVPVDVPPVPPSPPDPNQQPPLGDQAQQDQQGADASPQ